MPQYKSTWEEIVNSIIPSQQLAAKVSVKQQPLGTPQPADDALTQQLREAMKEDEWFRDHKKELIIREDLAWKEDKLYVPASQRTRNLQRSHDVKPAGHFGFVKTLHLPGRQFWWPKMKKDDM